MKCHHERLVFPHNSDTSFLLYIFNICAPNKPTKKLFDFIKVNFGYNIHTFIFQTNPLKIEIMAVQSYS